jgi:hypothetical protein
MMVAITKITNLTLKVDLDAGELTKFSSPTAYAETISGEAAVPDTWKVSHNIQVIWSEGQKAVVRAVGGTCTKEGSKTTISGLLDVSKYSFGVHGKLSIGPKTNPDAVSLSVRVGNIPSVQNKKADWIIDFSDTVDGGDPSSIKLIELIEWVKDKSGDADADVVFPETEGAGAASQPKNFEIVFKKFYYNITQNTFDFDVESKDKDGEGKPSEIVFGNFTIKKVGFRVTNVAAAYEETNAEEAKVRTLPAAIKKKTA